MARLRLLLRSARLLGLVALGLGLAAWVSLRERRCPAPTSRRCASA